MAGCHHKSVVTWGKHSNDLPQFRWINTLLGNLKQRPMEWCNSGGSAPA
jgi:hypothetical protein